jgi:hypothetical protein
MVVDSVPGTRYVDVPAHLSFLVAQTRIKRKKERNRENVKEAYVLAGISAKPMVGMANL